MVNEPAPQPLARRVAVIAAALAVVAIVAVADLLTSADISLSLFYLLPVGAATWYADRPTGVVMAVLSTVAVIAAHLADAHAPADRFIAGWQGFIHIGFMLAFVWLLDRLCRALHTQQRLASVDGLTGVLNRRAFMERLTYVGRLLAREGRPLTLAYIDLDDFKRVNDEHGHAEGDRTLQCLAECLRHSARSSDVLGRMGGDEFVVLLPDTDAAQAHHYIDKLRARLADTTACETVGLACSIGCVTFPAAGVDPEALLAAGDALMYRIKRAGKNQTAFAVQPEPHA